MLKNIWLVLLIAGFSSIQAQNLSNKLEWLTIEEAEEKLQTKPKKVLIDIYADWCYWCKKIDAELASDSSLVSYLKNNYFLVKLNPEDIDDVVFKGETYKRKSFKYSYSDKTRKVNELAVKLINEDFIYPSLIFLDENLDKITFTKGYKNNEELYDLIIFFGDNFYQKMKWEDYLTLKKQ